MTMTDLAGRRVIVSAHTLTVKDDTGKTRGMVRNVSTFNTATLREQLAVSKALRASGVWDAMNKINNLSRRTIIADGKAYLLRDTRYEEHYHKYFEGRGFTADDEHYNLYMQLYANASAHGITVIPCVIA